MRHSSRLMSGTLILGLALAVPALAAGPAHAAKKPWTVAVSAPGSVLANTAYTISGSIKPARSGQVARLQKASGKSWTTVTSAKTNGAGRYAFARSTPALGSVRYRISVAASTTSAASTSRAFTVTTKPHVTVLAGEYHSCSLNSHGAVRCWGDDQYGQLGNGPAIGLSDKTRSLVAVPVVGLSSGVTAISLVGDGYTTCALTSAGAVKCWGDNYFKELGNNSSASYSDVPVQVTGLTKGIVQVSAGYTHVCALTAGGAVKCWGQGTSGELGQGLFANSPLPVQVNGLTKGVASIGSLDAATCALTSAGAVKCWGENTYDELGNGVEAGPNLATPQPVSGLTHGVASLAAGPYTSCVILTTKGTKCWGWGQDGGIGDNHIISRPVPTQVVGLTSGVTAVSPGYDHTCAIVAGVAKCWGINSSGGLGTGGVATSLTPIATHGLSKGTRAISAGYFDTCAITSTGAVKCWGDNEDGEIGNATTNDAYLPVAVLSAVSLVV